MSKVVAWVLDESRAPAGDVVNLPDVPGLWMPGEAKTASALGVDVAEMRDLVKTLNLPLRETKAEDDSAALDRTGGMVSGAELDSAPETGDVRSSSPAPGLSADEYAEREAWDAEVAAKAKSSTPPEPEPDTESDTEPDTEAVS